MTREIKYRAWIKNKGKGEIMEYYDLLKDDSDRFLLFHCAIDLDMPIMQYTGLKDKRNRDIYEGDILKIGEVGNFEVKWTTYAYGNEYGDEPEGYTTGWIGKEVDGVREHLLNPHYMEFNEITGNIYENPDLLEE